MIATKEQEREALETIRNIVNSLGENSYVGMAFDGCFEIAEENIECDFAISMKDERDAARKKETEARKQADELKRQNALMQKQIEDLKARIEREQEWKPYEDPHNVSQKDYENVAAEGNYMTDEAAKELLYECYGFAKEKVCILDTLPKDEINRHGQIRTVGKVDRRPVYNSSDWNYICFMCGFMDYELYNDNLRFYLR